MRRPLFAWLLAGAALPVVLPSLLPVGDVHADTLSGTKSDSMLERAHDVEVHIGHGHAVLVVRRTFENPGTKHDQAMLHIYDLPSGGVATGLRSMGYQNGQPVWYVGDLLEAEHAAARYKELTGIGGYYPKDPALLSWRSADHLMLQVFPVEPKKTKTVEYTLEAPTSYADGRYSLTLPAMVTAFAATATIRAEDASDALFLDGIPTKSGAMRRLADALRIEIAAASPPKVSGTFASVTFAKGRALLRTAIEAAPKLSELPKNAHVVFVMDASRSLSDDERGAQVAAARAYLAHVPDAKVQVLLFDRMVRPLHDGFVTAKQADDDLRTLKWTPRNGSALDLALLEATKRISTAPGNVPRRIVTTSDLQLRSSIVPATFKTLDAQKATLHLAQIRAGDASLSRDDADPWAAIPRATGGVFWYARASKDGDGKKAQGVYEEWVRPLRIDRLVVSGVGYTSSNAPDSLAEGDAFEELRIGAFGTPAIEVKGELWSTPTKVVLASTPAEERRWAALVFGTSVRDELKEPEMMTLAMKGGAVSPVTSYLAIEPGVRPSTEGLDWGSGFGGSGGWGSGSGRMGSKHSVKISIPPDRIGWLRTKLAEIHAACGGLEKVHVRLESTYAELVAVDVVPQVGIASNAKLRACVEEGAWGLELPAMFNGSFATWELDVGN